MGESTVVKFCTTAFGACVVYLLGGADVMLTTLLIFLVVDYITGIFKDFNPRPCVRGDSIGVMGH